MISTFHIKSLKKRFPKAYEEYVSIGGTDDWETLCDWIEYKGYKKESYPIALRKIENSL